MRRVTLAAFLRPAGSARPILSSLSRRNLPPFFDFALEWRWRTVWVWVGHFYETSRPRCNYDNESFWEREKESWACLQQLVLRARGLWVCPRQQIWKESKIFWPKNALFSFNMLKNCFMKYNRLVLLSLAILDKLTLVQTPRSSSGPPCPKYAHRGSFI